MDKHGDRILGVLFALLVLVATIVVLANRNASWGWGLSLLVVIGLWAWIWKGVEKIAIGHRGQLLLFGERQNYFFGEGFHWALPGLFEIEQVDCRKQTMPVQIIEGTTEDNVKVFVGCSVVYLVENLHRYFNASPESLKSWIDNTRQEIIRTKVRTKKQAEVLNMHASLGEEMETALRKQGSEYWGIQIHEVVITEIKPDPEVAKDLALEERERLQQEGQQVEVKHFWKMVDFLVNGEVKLDGSKVGGGLTREQAIEQIQLALGKATKEIKAHTIALDKVTNEALLEMIKKATQKGTP